MATPLYKKSPIPLDLSPQIKKTAFANVSFLDRDLDVCGPFLRLGHIMKFGYGSRTRYKSFPKDQQMQLVNPIIIFCGSDRGRIHGIDLRVMDIFGQGSTLVGKFYLDYRRRYDKTFDNIDSHQLNKLNDFNSFSAKSLLSGMFGGKDIVKFYRSYKISDIKNRSVTIINIRQAEIESSSGHRTLPLTDYER